jgi:hypothetical protein
MRPAIRTLELQTGWSRTAVKKALRDLENWELIRATSRAPACQQNGRWTRQIVSYEIGDLLRHPPANNLRRALRAKEAIADARAKKEESNPEKTVARVIRSFKKHCPLELRAQSDELRSEVFTVPNETEEILRGVLNGDRRLPRTGEWRVTPNALLVRPQYASFAATDTRDLDPDGESEAA